MTRNSMLAILLAATTSCFVLPTAASAEGKTDQARKAIAAAQAKIDAANIVGAAGDAPRLHAEAVRVLHIAQDELNHHAKDEAIRDATRASEIADQALAASQRERTAQERQTSGAAQAEAAEANARAADALRENQASFLTLASTHLGRFHDAAAAGRHTTGPRPDVHDRDDDRNCQGCRRRTGAQEGRPQARGSQAPGQGAGAGQDHQYDGHDRLGQLRSAALSRPFSSARVRWERLMSAFDPLQTLTTELRLPPETALASYDSEQKNYTRH